VVNGESPDSSIRPNQIFAVSLTTACCRWSGRGAWSKKIQRDLMTPYGLRSCRRAIRNIADATPAARRNVMRLSSGDGMAVADGSIHHRLCEGERRNAGSAGRRAAEWLRPLQDQLSDGGLGHISEIFDGDPPQRPVGCIAQSLERGRGVARLRGGREVIRQTSFGAIPTAI